MNLLITSVRSTIAALLVVATAACGSSTEESSSPTTTLPTTVLSTTDATDADQPAADTIPDTTTTEREPSDSTNQPEIIDSVTLETVTIPADDPTVGSAAEELRDGVPIEKGKTYAIIDPSSGTGFSLVSAVDGAYPFLVSNAASISLDEAGLQGLITIYSLERLRTFIDPTTDFMQIPPDSVEAVTAPLPPDFFAWFAALPAVTVGPVETATVDGWPARRMTYTFGPSHNGLPCDSTSVAGCLVTLWNPAGSTTVYAPNDTGTLYEAVVDGNRALVDVSARPGAQEMFESLHFLFEKEG